MTKSGFLLLTAWFWVPTALPGTNSQSPGVIVEKVEAGSAVAGIGIRQSDRLTSWETIGPDAKGGELRSPFDVWQMEMERLDFGALRISGLRGGQTVSVVAPAGGASLIPLYEATRPLLPPEFLPRYLATTALFEDSPEIALSQWRQLARELAEAGESDSAQWLLSRISRFSAKNGQWDEAFQAAQNALRMAEAEGDMKTLGILGGSLGRVFEEPGRLTEAAELYRWASDAWRAHAPESLALARSLGHLGVARGKGGDLDPAVALCEEAIEIAERHAPEGLTVGANLNSLAVVARRRGQYSNAREYLSRSLAIKQKIAPGSHTLVATLSSLGNLSHNLGDLVAAERYYRQGLEIRERLDPEGAPIADLLSNLAVLKRERGDWLGAERLWHRSLAIKEKAGRNRLDLIYPLEGLGAVSSARGDFAAAARYLLRSRKIQEQLAPDSESLALTDANLGDVAFWQGNLAEARARYQAAASVLSELVPEGTLTAMAYQNLGVVARDQGDLAAAAENLTRALELQAKIAPSGLDRALTLHSLGTVEIARGETKRASELFHEALRIRERRAPQSLAEGETCHELATLYRSQGNLERTLSFYGRAVDTLEAHRGKLGGGSEIRADWAGQYAEFYRDYLELLVEQEKPEEAFHLLERYRARDFLNQLARRDLTFEVDLGEDLDRERRLAVAAYDRALRELTTASTEGDEAARSGLLQKLQEARNHKDAVEARVLSLAPRLAEFENPRVFDLNETQRALDPGTLLLSYSVGPTRSYLFAVGPEPGEIQIDSLPVTDKGLQAAVMRFLDTLSQGHFDHRQTRVRFQADRLGTQLLAPVADQIVRAERLLVLTDGPLHSLPFAALTAPSEDRYLVEIKPVYTAASATVFAALKSNRRNRKVRVAAFADPEYPPRESAEAAPVLRTALRQGLALPPLPASRREVDAVCQLSPAACRRYLGRDASEEKTKNLPPGTTHLHFAVHGFLDDRFPLESFLALSVPSRWREGEENGLLQAWEIIEQIRIDADLVTLSACNTGRGKAFAGEGLLGLSRAFQYAGARSVLASLWSVSDRSTGQLMTRFYGYLEEGLSKVEALRRAQLDLLRNPDFAHPYHWAGFELIGDWK